MLDFIKQFLFKPGPRYSFTKVLLILLLSTCLVAVLFFAGSILTGSLNGISKRHSSCIHRIAVTGPSAFQLSAAYLAEVLDLSVDYPTNLVEFDLKQAKEKLYATHLIKNVHLKKIKPDILYLNYTLREPIAFLDDMTNTAIDSEGHLFPFAPFFSAKNLPSVYLGESDASKAWGENLKEEHVQLIADIFHHFDSFAIKKLDLSYLASESYGKKQMIVLLNNGRTIRLSPKNYPQEIKKYFLLEKLLLKDEPGKAIIDLRTENVAYIERNQEI